MADINIWALAGTGFVAGTFGAMMGIGGGILIIPILTLLLGVPMQNAIGSSLVAIVINALTATSIYIRNHMANLNLGFLLSCTLVPGAIAGALLGHIIPGSMLSLIFAALLIYVAYNLFPKKPTARKAGTGDTGRATLIKKPAAYSWLNNSYYDQALKREVKYSVQRLTAGLTGGFFAGVVSSLLGVGGGIINIPVMNLIMKVPFKAAIATGSLLLCFTTMTGATVYALNGYVVPHLIAPLTAGIFLGAQLGSFIGRRVQDAVLLRVFTFILILTAASMILKALNLY